MPTAGVSNSRKAVSDKKTPEEQRLDAVKRWVGNEVCNARRTACMTQEALAEKVNCSVDTIKRIEAGKVSSFDMLFFISEALEVPFCSFFPPRARDTKDYVREMRALLDVIEGNLS